MIIKSTNHVLTTWRDVNSTQAHTIKTCSIADEQRWSVLRVNECTITTKTVVIHETMPVPNHELW